MKSARLLNGRANCKARALIESADGFVLAAGFSNEAVSPTDRGSRLLLSSAAEDIFTSLEASFELAGGPPEAPEDAFELPEDSLGPLCTIYRTASSKVHRICA